MTSSKRLTQDPYETLGVPRQADDKAIKQAYFRLVRDFPPEKDPERFQAIRAAYEQVRTAERRAQADLFLLQPPPELPNRRRPAYDLTVQPTDLLRLAMELRLADHSPEEDFHEPTLPNTP